MKLSSIERTVLTQHPKAVCHLNYAANLGEGAKHGRQLGFILGSGVSHDLKIPGWSELLDAIEEELGYTSSDKRGPQSYRGEQLFQYFRKRQLAILNVKEREVREASINTAWRKMVTRHLYANYNQGQKEGLINYRQAIEKHSYLMHLAAIAIDLELVITHNFDNALETALSYVPTERLENRRSHSFWKPDPFLRPEILNIYHPNGFTPTDGLKGSDSIVLTEANFADHLANTNNAEANFLLGHLSSKTWLIIGHSLADGTLKNALRIHAGRRPGHISYFVHFQPKGGQQLSNEQREAIREANFVSYNLYTLFLDSDEIGALLRLIKRKPADLKSAMSSCSLPHRYIYYMCGAVSSGKSTVLGHLRSFATVEEWPSQMPTAMNKLSIEATPQEREEIDEELGEALFKKNDEIDDTKVGIVVVDRAPLDFIAFPNSDGEAARTTAVARYGKVLKLFVDQNFQNLCAGQVIVVQADPTTLLERQIQRGRTPQRDDPTLAKAKEALSQQQNIILDIYKSAISDDSTAYGDCCTIAECVQDIIKIIMFKEYRPFDFKQRLNEYIEGTQHE